MNWQQLVNDLIGGIEGDDPGAIAGAIAGMLAAGVGNAFDIAAALQAGQAVEVTNPDTGQTEVLQPVAETPPATTAESGALVLTPTMLAVAALLLVLVLR